MYTIKYSDEAKADLALLRKSVPAAFKKVKDREVLVLVLAAYGHYDDK